MICIYIYIYNLINTINVLSGVDRGQYSKEGRLRREIASPVGALGGLLGGTTCAQNYKTLKLQKTLIQ